MLARASSDAGTRDVAQQHALAAATAAFARAQVHDTANRKTKRSSDMSRSKSNASHKSLSSQGSHFPPRESSFRSLQPQKNRQTINSPPQPCAPTTNAEQFPSFYPTLSSDRPLSVPRPLTAQSSISFNDNARPRSQSKPLRQSASTSVASQQIRKARSMYYASNIQTGSPIARPPAKYLTTPPAISASPASEPVPALQPTRTLGPSPLAGPRIPVTVEADETVDEARDKYLQSFQQKTVKHKPSIFLAPFKKRQDKGKDKNRRLTSGTISASISSQRTPDESTAGLDEFLPQHETKERRSFSGSLKSRFKRVFRRTSNKSPNLPVQHIDASRDYFSAALLSPPEPDEAHAIPSPDEETMQRVRSRISPLEGGYPAFIRSASRSSSNGSARSNRSNRSLHSEANAPHTSVSRVTSWGTSSTEDTLTQRAIKRLTVIHEAKDSIGSEAERVASIMPRRKSLPPLPVLSAFRDPMPMESLTEESSTPVDPKRVFSALMREIGTSKPAQASSDLVGRTPGAESDVFESSETKGFQLKARELHSSASRDSRPSMGSDQRPTSAAAHSVQSKTSTIRSLGRAIRSTIRTVTPTEQQTLPCPELADSASYHSDNQQHSTKMFTPSASQIEKRAERANDRWKTPLDEVEKIQFPRETDRTYDVTNFAQQTTSYETSDNMTPLSPSMYSRNTDGISILPNDSFMTLSRPEEHDRHDGGSAVILASQSVRSYVIGTPSPRRPGSMRTSRDWKAWLSHEISGMEATSQEDLVTPSGQCPEAIQAALSAAHRRDTTHTSHTEHSDTTVILRGAYETSTRVPHLDITTTSTSSRMNDRFPFIDTGRCSSSNSARSSRKSKSPTDSVASSKSLKSPKVTRSTPGLSKIYSDLSAPATNQNSPRVPNKALGISDTQHRRKENVTPPYLQSRGDSQPDVSPSGSTSRPTTLQPLSSGTLNRNTPSIGQYIRNAPETKQEKHNSSPTTTPVRPRIRASLRPISPEKLARRPKSAFDLRATNAPYPLPAAARSNIGGVGTPSPLRSTELRRPALHLKASSSSLALNKEPSPGTADRVIDGVLGGGGERSGSVTPGQRMADRFLKQRKSATVLEDGKMRGGLRLAREDTPAFL